MKRWSPPADVAHLGITDDRIGVRAQLLSPTAIRLLRGAITTVEQTGQRARGKETGILGGDSTVPDPTATKEEAPLRVDNELWQ